MRTQPEFLSKEALESIAEYFLRVYRGDGRLEDRIPLDIDDFAEFHLRATIDYHQLSSDGSVLGMSVFRELTVPAVGDGSCKADMVFPARTIVIDHKALSKSPESRLRFTIAHECAHLILHHDSVLEDSPMRCSSRSSYRALTTESENARTDSFDRAEYQANYLGAALLMPRSTFSRAYRELVPDGWYGLEEQEKHKVVSVLADAFETSLMATSLRIKNLKLAR